MVLGFSTALRAEHQAALFDRMLAPLERMTTEADPVPGMRRSVGIHHRLVLIRLTGAQCEVVPRALLRSLMNDPKGCARDSHEKPKVSLIREMGEHR